jgi:hypothetical protein
MRALDSTAHRAAPARYRVCSEPGCAVLLAPGESCPQHSRRVTSGWAQRDHAAHKRWARALKRATPYCQRCGSTEKLDAHHGPNGVGVVLCNACHCLEDRHARPR